MNRRTFLATTGMLLPGAAMGWPGDTSPRPRVVVARRKGLVAEGGDVDPIGVRELLGRAIAAKTPIIATTIISSIRVNPAPSIL